MAKRPTRKTRVKPQQAIDDAMGQAIAKFLATKGWLTNVVGPCEVRVPHSYVGNQRIGDVSGKTLAQYEFIAKFYGRRAPEDPCADKR